MEYIADQDIYDNQGMLLISKGETITEEMLKRLETLGRAIPKDGAEEVSRPISSEIQWGQGILSPAVMELGARMNVSNFSRLEEANRILSDIIFESKTKPWWIYVNALSNYVDWLYSHSINVATISLMMASELEYREEEMINLGVAALLHDVGMLLIPKGILQKEAPLTETEMELVKQHCELGLSSLAGFDLPKEYMDVALQHHERMDGSGYPKRLKGEAISYNARIVMIADAVDGITSSRPHKEAKTMQQAIEILREEKSYAPELIGLAEDLLL